MLLRPRQKILVDRALKKLEQENSTLAIAPTGGGKTLMISAIIGERFKVTGGKACVLAHRDELTSQNQQKFTKINPHLSTSIYDASHKSWQGQTTFAMVQTLSRPENLVRMPPLDLLVIDEAHHARAQTYLRIIEHAQSMSPMTKILGMTATPNRGDKKGLGVVFSNVCDQVQVGELVASGHLVKPRTFVMDVGVQAKLCQVQKIGAEYDMEAVSQIMDVRPVNDAVVTHWKAHAGDRKTVVFCSTVRHAHSVREAFIEAGIATVWVHGGMSAQEREQTLDTYAAGGAQVIVNVAVLTEGWDDPPTSCIVLLRPSSYKSTLIQMIGRGLRPVLSQDYPGIVKTDCLVLDFGTATLMHGSIEQSVCLSDQDTGDGEAPCKHCPECDGSIPIASTECPLCGFVFSVGQTEETDEKVLQADEFNLVELDILRRSNFVWKKPSPHHQALIAKGFKAWSGIFLHQNRWHALGALNDESPVLLTTGDKDVCLGSADDFMNTHETHGTAHKDREWLYLPATERQRACLQQYVTEPSMTRYEASTLMVMKHNDRLINHILTSGEQA